MKFVSEPAGDQEPIIDPKDEPATVGDLPEIYEQDVANTRPPIPIWWRGPAGRDDARDSSGQDVPEYVAGPGIAIDETEDAIDADLTAAGGLQFSGGGVDHEAAEDAETLELVTAAVPAKYDVIYQDGAGAYVGGPLKLRA